MHGAANRAASVKVKREVGARKSALVPSIYFILICVESGGDSFFRGGAIRPSGSGGNVALTIEPLAEFFVSAPNVFVECVPAALFVAAKVVAIARARLPC
jgi:hypothetical protein